MLTDVFYNDIISQLKDIDGITVIVLTLREAVVGVNCQYGNNRSLSRVDFPNTVSEMAYRKIRFSPLYELKWSEYLTSRVVPRYFIVPEEEKIPQGIFLSNK